MSSQVRRWPLPPDDGDPRRSGAGHAPPYPGHGQTLRDPQEGAPSIVCMTPERLSERYPCRRHRFGDTGGKRNHGEGDGVVTGRCPEMESHRVRTGARRAPRVDLRLPRLVRDVRFGVSSSGRLGSAAALCLWAAWSFSPRPSSRAVSLRVARSVFAKRGWPWGSPHFIRYSLGVRPNLARVREVSIRYFLPSSRLTTYRYWMDLSG